MRRRFLLIANPAAGIANTPLVENVARSLRQAGATITRTVASDLTQASCAAKHAAVAGTCDAVIAAGGDGTIRHVARAMIATNMPLGIIPVGTGNVLAHEIGLAASTSMVSHTLLHGPVASVALAEAGGEPFLLMVGAGFDARVLSMLDQDLKSRIGKVAYAGPLLRALVRPVDRLQVTVDGRSHIASWAVIANAMHYGGGFAMAPRTHIFERGLEAILFKAKDPVVLLRQLMKLAAGQLEPHTTNGGTVEMLRCSRVTLEAQERVPTQIDGDVFGTTPLEVDAGTTELHLIVPSAGKSARQSALWQLDEKVNVSEHRCANAT